MIELILTQEAEDNIEDIWKHGVKKWGLQTAIDYDQLISRAVEELAIDPDRPGTRIVRKHADKNMPSLHAYPLEFANKRSGKKIGKPAHSVFYFTINDNRLVISSITRPERQRYINGLDVKKMLEDVIAQTQQAKAAP